tara:strand:+ start:41 stop:619 length:579 start_codon:yes stop_codon:yes gene_type:complete
MEHLLFKAFLLAAVLTLFTILLTRKENNYLETTGAASTKKLMVVDQTSGAISFLNDSVGGVNQKFLQNDATQAALLKALFGDSLDGSGGVFKAKIDELLAAGGPIASTYETKVLADDRLASLEGSIGECVSTRRANKFTLWSGNAEKVLADDGCDGSPGSNSTNQKAGWCKEGTGGRSFKVFFTKGESYSGA